MFEEKSKEMLLHELQQLGVHPTGRKVRADKGSNHNYSRTQSAPRADKGKTHQSYPTQSPSHCRKVFFELLRKNTDPASGEGDNLTRDVNMIFPPSTTRFYKLVTVKPGVRITKDGGSSQVEGYTYRSSQKKAVQPEELRWRWYFSEYFHATDPTEKEQWLRRICNWYFIYPHDIEIWTYTEWAWSYVHELQGHSNRHPSEQRLLSYDEYLSGAYGRMEYDEKGDVIWPI